MRLCSLLVVVSLAGRGDRFVEVEGLRCRTDHITNTAVDLQVAMPSSEAARDQATRSAGLPGAGWVLAESNPSTAEFRLEADGRPASRIAVAHVTAGSGYPTDGWTVSGVTSCSDRS
jgi:hypothetical protein